MWTSLRGRFVVLMLLTMGGGMAAAILIINEIERDEALRAIEREETSLADSVRQVVASSLEREAADRRRLRQLTEELAHSRSVLWIEVFDGQSRVIAHTDHTRVGQQPLEQHRECVERILAGSEPISEEDAEQKRFNLFVPLTQDGSPRPFGVVEVVLLWKPGQPAPIELGRAAAAAAQSALTQGLINAKLERERLQRLIENLAKGDSLTQIEVFGRDARVIAHSQAERIGGTALPEHASVVRSVIQNGRPARLVSDEEKAIALLLPIVSQGDSSVTTRVVSVAIDPTPILARLAQSRTRYLWSFAAIAFVAGTALWACSDKLVFQPLARVTRAAREVAEGRVGTTISCNASGQISELVDAFNHMSHSLESTMVSRDELAVSEERLQLALEATHTSCWDVELDSDFVVSTGTMEPLMGYKQPDVLPSREWWQSLVHPNDVAIKEQALQDYINGVAPIYECEYRVRAASGEWRWTLDRGRAVTRDEDGRPRRMVGTDTDITRLKLDEQLLQGHNCVLEAIALGKPLADVFSLLIEVAETADPGAKATAMILNRHTGLLHGIGRNRMPERYNRNTDTGIPIGYGVGSCGTAAFLKQRMVISDAMTHEYWDGHRDVVEMGNFRACWSEPILDADGEVLGTFAVYHDVPRQPGEDSLHVIEAAARLASIAIQRDQVMSDLRVRDRALASTSNGIIIVDATQPDLPVAYCNRAFERITGFDSSDVIGRHCWFLHSGEPNQPALEEVRAAIREQRGCRVTLRNNRENGEPFWNELTISPVVDDDGKVTHFVGVQDDVTQRLDAEKELITSELRFRTLFDFAPEAITVFDVETMHFVDFNQNAVDLFGVDRNSLLTIGPIDLSPELQPNGRSSQSLGEEMVARALAGEAPTFEWQHVRPDGTLVATEVRLVQLPSDDRVLIRGSVTDISQRKQLEQERREALARFESIASNIPDCFWRTKVNPDGSYQVEYVSPAWEVIWGYPADDILSNPDLWVDVVLDEDKAVAHQAFEHVLTTGEWQTASYRIRTRNGDVRWIEDRMSAVFDESGNVTQLEGVARDVTEQRNAEELARQQMEQLAHVGRLTTVGELATGIAHELNQPLTAIVNTAFTCEQNLSQNEQPSTKALRKSVATISEQAFRASEIIRRLRSLVKRAPLAVSTFDVNRAIDEVVSLIRPIARQNGIALRLSLDDALPAISADEIQFQQVILNLLKNACDALQQKTAVERQIAVESHLTDTSDVMVSVSDNGPGLSGGAASQAFEAFFTTKDEGMGMGLAISRSIIETHRGRLWAENNSQGGATFRLTLPVTMERKRRA